MAALESEVQKCRRSWRHFAPKSLNYERIEEPDLLVMNVAMQRCTTAGSRCGPILCCKCLRWPLLHHIVHIIPQLSPLMVQRRRNTNMTLEAHNWEADLRTTLQ